MLSATLLAVPQAIAYFNPAGEVLLAAETVNEGLASAFDEERPPFELWANVRVFSNDRFTVLDTVGMQQLDLDDHEACFQTGRYDQEEVARFLDRAAFFVLDREMANPAGGEATNGPGGFTWRAERAEAVHGPPRPALRWSPVDGFAPADVKP